MEDLHEVLICGVGIEDEKVIDQLRHVDVVLSRGQLASNWLLKNNINNLTISPDGGLSSSDAILDHYLTCILSSANIKNRIAYVTPITPWICDRIASRLCAINQDYKFRYFSGVDLSGPLLQRIASYGPSSLVTIDGIALRDLHHPPFSSSHNVIIYFPEIGKKTDGVISLLEKVYPAQQVVAVLFDQKTNPLEWEWVSLESLKESSESVAALFIPPLSLDSTLESFQEVIAHLRAEDGCPWDKKQTHSSLRPYLLEETYEALDSLDKGDLTGLKEELGDLLLQIALHAQIAEEAQEFTMADVLTGINRKIVYRHPHVFKDWVVDGEKEVVQNWESLKGQERLKNGTEETKGMLEGVPVSFPALAQAQAIQERAARVGFDWPEITPVLDKVMEELEEVRTAANDVERAKELGDLLFALVNLVRWYKMDAESALRQTNLKFRKRFAYIEEKARITENSLQKMTLAEMDKFWEESKAFDD